ncbi:MAG: protein-L-isoaspartate O-methyltransferase [Gammaproteobacteria bacterium]|jgi:protein-L-isoaspartate(D-aspartate) O-methyltransferase|nr:protein-L-isoaspartate O-methyltransferase [Gammaproteobacteria bacterium]
MTAFDTELARHNMLEQQIRPWEVIDQRALDAMAAVPRERFVPERFQGLAFADTEIPLAHGESMLAPKIEAKLLQALDVQPTDRVLEVGTGSGYLAACLSRLGGHVVTVEIHPDLHDEARARLVALGVQNVECIAGDAFSVAVPGVPFDVIAVTGSVPRLPVLLEGMLAEGGRLFAVVGEPPAQRATLVTRIRGDVYRRETLFETVLPPLHNAPRPAAFVF